jgi:hypothetical protein
MATQKHAKGNDFDRFWRHFPRRSEDVALVVLKGHLLLEESVNSLLASLLLFPEAIEGANLRFHQKLCLIEALLPVDPDMMEAAGTASTLVRASGAYRLPGRRDRAGRGADPRRIALWLDVDGGTFPRLY